MQCRFTLYGIVSCCAWHHMVHPERLENYLHTYLYSYISFIYGDLIQQFIWSLYLQWRYRSTKSIVWSMSCETYMNKKNKQSKLQKWHWKIRLLKNRYSGNNTYNNVPVTKHYVMYLTPLSSNSNNTLFLLSIVLEAVHNL